MNVGLWGELENENLLFGRKRPFVRRICCNPIWKFRLENILAYLCQIHTYTLDFILSIDFDMIFHVKWNLNLLSVHRKLDLNCYVCIEGKQKWLTSLSRSLELSASLGATDDVVSRSDALPLSSDVPGSCAIVSEFCNESARKKWKSIKKFKMSINIRAKEMLQLMYICAEQLYMYIEFISLENG